ncbi:MAG: SCO family protein [Algoriphagus sp.]
MRNFLITSIFWLTFACSQPQKSSIPFYNSPDFTPYFISEAEASTQISHRIKPFAFYNQDSVLFDSKSLEGKLYVANFFFTQCNNICPDMTAQLKRIEKAFVGNPQIALLSFSVTPWIDDVKTLQRFSEKNQISSLNWNLLTGSKEEIYTLARKSFFAEESIGYNKETKEFLHTEHFILVDQKGRIRGIYNGTLALDAERCIEDMQAILKEG